MIKADCYTGSVKRMLAQIDIGEALKIGSGKSVKEIFTGPSGDITLGHFISQILPNLYVITGLILFILLIGGGLTVIVSAGQDNPEGAAKGKKAVTAALVGFLIIFASYWLIQIVEIVFGVKIFEAGL